VLPARGRAAGYLGPAAPRTQRLIACPPPPRHACRRRAPSRRLPDQCPL